MNARFKKIEKGFFLSDLREEVTRLDHLSEPAPDQGFFKLQQLLDLPFRDGGLSASPFLEAGSETRTLGFLGSAGLMLRLYSI